MIRIKSLARELDAAVITIEFDDSDGNLHEITHKVSASLLNNMTEEEIKRKIKNVVAIKRMNLIETSLREKLEKMMGVDLEAGESAEL